MPRTSLAVQSIAASPTLTCTVTFSNADAVNGMAFKNSQGVLLIVKSTETNPFTVTVASVPEPRTGRLGNVAKTVNNGDVVLLGPFGALDFEQPTGVVHVDFSVGGATVRVAAVRPAST